MAEDQQRELLNLYKLTLRLATLRAAHADQPDYQDLFGIVDQLLEELKRWRTGMAVNFCRSCSELILSGHSFANGRCFHNLAVEIQNQRDEFAKRYDHLQVSHLMVLRTLRALMPAVQDAIRAGQLLDDETGRRLESLDLALRDELAGHAAETVRSLINALKPFAEVDRRRRPDLPLSAFKSAALAYDRARAQFAGIVEGIGPDESQN